MHYCWTRVFKVIMFQTIKYCFDEILLITVDKYFTKREHKITEEIISFEGGSSSRTDRTECLQTPK